MTSSIFPKAKLGQIKSNVAISGLELPSQHVPVLIEFKSIDRAVWVMNYFPQ